ncbi:MAG TPA: hypothetical protein VI385_12710 [Flavisolibacter sp.]|jgi:hypothetical protein
MRFKRRCFVFFLLVVYSGLYGQTITISDTTGQFRKLNTISRKYLGVDLQSPFDSIIYKVYNNPELAIDTTIAHSDSSAFYVRAYHKTFNPFTIALDSVRLIIAEIRRFDSKTKAAIDTVFYLQTEGIAVGETQIKNIRPKFYSVNKEMESSAWHSNYGKTKVKKELTAESFTYYSPLYRTPIANITWKRISDDKAVIVVTLELHLQHSSY